MNLLSKLKYSFINAFRVQLIDRLFFLLNLIILIYFGFFWKEKLAYIAIYLPAFIAFSCSSSINKNLNIFAMVNFPCNLKEIILTLFAKHSLLNICINLAALIIVSFFTRVDVYFIIIEIIFFNYYSFFFYLIIQVYLRMIFEIDLIFAFLFNISASIFMGVIYLMNYISAIFLTGFIVVFLVCAILFGLSALNNILLTKIYEILEIDG